MELQGEGLKEGNNIYLYDQTLIIQTCGDWAEWSGSVWIFQNMNKLIKRSLEVMSMVMEF